MVSDDLMAMEEVNLNRLNWFEEVEERERRKIYRKNWPVMRDYHGWNALKEKKNTIELRISRFNKFYLSLKQDWKKFVYYRIRPYLKMKHLKLKIENEILFVCCSFFHFFLLSSVGDFWALNRLDNGAGDDEGGNGVAAVCDCSFSFGLDVVVDDDENEFWTCISVPNVLDTCCCNEFDAFLCMPNIVNANCVPIGVVGDAVGSFVEGEDVACLFFCRSRLADMIVFIKRVGALPTKSFVFSIKLINSNWIKKI